MNQYDSTAVPTVERLMRSNKFLRYIQGPFGSGKSTGCVHELVQRASRQLPNADGIRYSRWAVVRNTYPQLRDSTIRTWLDWYPDGVWGKYKSAEHEYHMHFRLQDGTEVKAEVLFRALDGPNNVGNLLSVEYTGGWINEAREISYEIFEALQGRVGRYPSKKDAGPTWDGIILDSNPPDTDHWLYRVFEEDKPENAEAFYQPSGLSKDAENLDNLKDGYYDNMALGKDPDWVRVYIDGKYGFVREGKPVYVEYNDQVHCREVKYSKNLPIIRGWDFGRTPACVFVQVTHRGQLRIIDELTSEGMGIEVFAKQVLDYTLQNYPDAQIERDIGDPSGGFGNDVTETTPFSVLWDKKVMIEEGQQDLDIRLSSVKSRLSSLIDGNPGLVIDPRCRILRKGFIGGYCYKRLQMSGERYQDKPDKQGKYSHPHDALQYICTLMFDGYSERESRPVRVVGGFS